MPKFIVLLRSTDDIIQPRCYTISAFLKYINNETKIYEKEFTEDQLQEAIKYQEENIGFKTDIIEVIDDN